MAKKPIDIAKKVARTATHKGRVRTEQKRLLERVTNKHDNKGKKRGRG